jgi:hypothetical protein
MPLPIRMRARRSAARRRSRPSGTARRGVSRREHLAQFRADPARYAPAYDGHCAYAASEGRKSAGMPELWQVTGGRLYLLCSKSAFEKWTSEFDTRLARANANWVTLEPLPAARPNPPPPATPNPPPSATR